MKLRAMSALTVATVLLAGCGSVPTTSATGPTALVFPPSAGRGRPVLVISGLAGVDGVRGAYRRYAGKIAEHGYCVVLVDGNDLFRFSDTESGRENAHKAVRAARTATCSTGEPVRVVGFSLGGRGALYTGELGADVARVIVFYPVTINLEPGAFAHRLRVPVLALMGEGERSLCCDVRKVRDLAEAVTKQGVPFALVTYPQADHGFNLPELPGAFMADAAEDSWHRLLEALASR